MNARPKHFMHPWRRFAVPTVAFTLFFSGLAFGAEACGSLERMQAAMKLTRILYPDLQGKDFNVAVARGLPSGGSSLTSATDVRSLRITLDKPEWASPGALLPPSTISGEWELPLSFNFSFIEADYPVGQVVCRPVEFESNINQRLKALQRMINAHPEWTDSQILATAREQGIRFGPDDKPRLLRAFPLHRLTPLYGPLRLTNAAFHTSGAEKCSGCTFAELRWSIELVEVGTPRRLHIFIEPFTGRVVSLTESK
jgi:hypothetical protein